MLQKRGSYRAAFPIASHWSWLGLWEAVGETGEAVGPQRTEGLFVHVSGGCVLNAAWKGGLGAVVCGWMRALVRTAGFLKLGWSHQTMGVRLPQG